MLRQLLLVGGLTTVMSIAPQVHIAQAQSAQPQAQQANPLAEIKNAIATAGGYDGKAVQLTATKVQLVVTLANSKAGSAIERESEAIRIVSAITTAIAGKPDFKTIQAIHVDYVTRDADGHAHTIDAIDFRKDTQGKFQHHMT